MRPKKVIRSTAYGETIVREVFVTGLATAAACTVRRTAPGIKLSQRSSAGQVKCLAAVFCENTAKGGLTGEAADPLAAVQGSVPP